MNLRSSHGKEDASPSGKAPAGGGAGTPKRQAPPARSTGRKTPTKADLDDLLRELSPEPQPVEPPIQPGLSQSPSTRAPAAGGNESSTLQSQTRSITGETEDTAAPPTTPASVPPPNPGAGDEVVQLSRRDLESMAARAATVAAQEVATLAAREAVRALTAARPDESPAYGVQTHYTAKATTDPAENVLQTGDPSHSAASPVRATGVGSACQDPGHDRGAPDVTCLGSQIDSSGADGFSAFMGRVTHVDAAQHAAHQARTAGGSVAEQIVRAGAVGGGSPSSPTGPHAGYGEPWHAGGGGAARPIWNAEEALRRDKEASSLRPVAPAQQEEANRAGVSSVRSTASQQLASLGLTEAQLAGLQATFGLSEAQLRGVRTDATPFDPRAAKPVLQDEPSFPPTGHALGEQGMEWRSGSHVRFSPSTDEADNGRGSSAQSGDQWYRGSSSGRARFGRGCSAQSGDQWFSGSTSDRADFDRGSSVRGGGNYGNGRSELSSISGPRVPRAAAEPTLAEQAQSNATTAHIESKIATSPQPHSSCALVATIASWTLLQLGRVSGQRCLLPQPRVGSRPGSQRRLSARPHITTGRSHPQCRQRSSDGGLG